MKYPFIGEAKLTGAKVLFFTAGCGTVLDGETYEIGNYNERFSMPAFIDITHEFLANTYGEVVSPEHAEFIIELCASNEIKTKAYRYSAMSFFMIVEGELYFYSDETMPIRNKCKQITIPLPPKADNQESSEWLCVGSIVTWGNKSVKGEVKALSDGLAWIKNEYGNYCSEYVSSLQKPKTPEEELRDNLESEIKSMVNFTNYNPRKIAEWIIGGEIEGLSYDIKKKPQ